jgi:hypothetical protein
MLGPLRSRRLSVGLGFMLWSAAAAPASADDGWLVTEVEVGGAGAAVAAARVAGSLQRQGQRVLAGSDAASQFERVDSRKAVQLTPAQVKQLDDEFRKLADHLASDDLAAAQPMFRRLAELSPDSRDVLNRDPGRARRGFQICLLSGHMLSRLGRDSEGLQQVTTCAADYPGFQPQVGSYLPDSIRKFFDRAFARLDSVPVATLTVSVPAEHAGRCRARVNGIAAGASPATVSGIRATEVRVQLDCGERPGRIHPLELQPGDNAIEIDPALDEAVTTGEQLGLRYADVNQARERAIGHAVRLARVLGQGRAVLLLGDELWRLDTASERAIARVSVNDGPLDALVARLVRGAVPAPDPVERAAMKPAPGSDESGFPYQWLAFGSAGAAVLSGGVALLGWAKRESVMKEHNADAECVYTKSPPDRCDALLHKAAGHRKLIVAGTIAAGGFAALSVVFFVLDGTNSDTTVAGLGRCGPGPGDFGLACRLNF